MADNFGSGQPRVLTVDDRSLDNIVFQYRRPPLTSEWNLINQIGSQKVQDAVRVSLPSGWRTTAGVLQDKAESDACTGEILCSETYAANSFKIMVKSPNAAVVNGWPLLVQGTDSPTDDNIVRLPAPTGQKYDFVFLEVWRELVGYQDPIYPYGNVDHAPVSDNEVLYAPAGTETTKRVQLRYRIRSASIGVNLLPSSDVFSDVQIHPIAARITGENILYFYASAGARDIGLYVTGDGSPTAKTELGTVDGYSYAIPLCLVYRRQPLGSPFASSAMNGAFTTKALSAAGYVSDRPDSAIADVIYADDIVDMRHKIVSTGSSLETLMKQSFRALFSGQLRTTLGFGFDRDGGHTYATSGGSVLTKVERINSVGGDGIPSMGTGSAPSAGPKRRAFCHASVTHDHNVILVPHSGSWAYGDQVPINSFLDSSIGELVSVDGFYNTSVGPVEGVSRVNISGTWYIKVTGSLSDIIGQPELYMEYTWRYAASQDGHQDVPDRMLGVTHGTTQIALRGATVPVRYNNAGQLLNFGVTPNAGDTDPMDNFSWAGACYTDNWAFGHELRVYRTTDGSGNVPLSLVDGKLNGIWILGVKSVETVSAPGTYLPFTQVRNGSLPITLYTVSSLPTTTAVIITLYTGSKSPVNPGDAIPDYESVKFFETNRQGRGVVDTYEMVEAIATEGPSGRYTIDTTAWGRPIIAIATKAVTTGLYASGTPYGWDNTGVMVSIDNNPSLPVLKQADYTNDLLPTKVVVTATPGLFGGQLRVPVLVHSHVGSAESPYDFFYKSTPYQGVLSGSVYGQYVSEGQGLLTTAGSGALTEYGYIEGYASVANGSRTVTGSIGYTGLLPKWPNRVKKDDYICIGSSSKAYRVLSVGTNVLAPDLTLYETYEEATVSNSTYMVIRLDTVDGPGNVVDRLPAYAVSTISGDVADYSCAGDDLIYDGADVRVVDMVPTHRSIDPTMAVVNTFRLGESVAKRGRNDVRLGSLSTCAPEARPDVTYLPLATEMYKGRKIYQAYLFNKSEKGTGGSDLTGRVYLAVISGERLGTTENRLNAFESADTVDLFEMQGRPIMRS